MNKSVLVSIKPYYVFLIIARKMGWDIPQEKTIEVRKDFPKDKEWNRVVHIYCSKDIKSFNLIPTQYQPLMGKFLGKVIGEFVCNAIYKWNYDYSDGVDIDDDLILDTCLDREGINIYANGKNLYGWHISNLKTYSEPKELSEFRKPCPYTDGTYCLGDKCEYYGSWTGVCRSWVERPFQSWGYVKSLGE